jgi:anaerobic selenocysteine-containing dehydrogenase
VRPSSVVHTGVKSAGWLKNTAHESFFHSWNEISPSVVIAVKSGAVSPRCSPMVCTPRSGMRARGNMALMTEHAEPTAERIAIRTCPLCEAGCGLEITLTPKPDGSGETVKRIRGDRDDVFSRGFICPKGSTLGHLHDDPDWLRRPVVKRDGEFVEVDWDEAFATIEAGLSRSSTGTGVTRVRSTSATPAPTASAPLFYNRSLITALGTGNRFSASDGRPATEGDVGGDDVRVGHGAGSRPRPHRLPPDARRQPARVERLALHRTRLPRRLDRIQERGGKVVWSTRDAARPPRRPTSTSRSDPAPTPTSSRRSRTCSTTPTGPSRRRRAPRRTHQRGCTTLIAALARYTPESVATTCGVDADTIRALAHDLAAAPTAAVYGRIGTCTQEFGTLASWLVDVVNLLSGNLDRVGGAMFTTGAVGSRRRRALPGLGPRHAVRPGRARSGRRSGPRRSASSR